MKRLWKRLNVELPPVFGCLPKAFNVIIIAGLLIVSGALVIEPAIKTFHAISKVEATVDGSRITRQELQDSLRAHLWRRGESWDLLNDETKNARRQEALDGIINDRLIANFSPQTQIVSPSRHRESEEAFQQFLKQFPPPDEWKQRMEQQGLTETKLRKSIGDEVKHLDAIERWLAEQPGRITEADARSWCDAHKDSLTIPERVRASHVFLTRHDKDKLDREPEIRELHRKLLAKESTLEELARQFSDDDGSKLRGGDLGWFSRNRVPLEFADKVFALPVGQISAPFESHLGWHILVVREKRPARAPEFAEVRDEIIAMLESQWCEASLKRLVNELRAKAKIEKFEARIADVHL